MIFAVLRGSGLTENIIFDRAHPANRDDCFAPYAMMREKFSTFAVQLNTADRTKMAEAKFEIHQDVQTTSISSINYLLMFETEFVRSENGNLDERSKYRKIFTWNDELVDGHRFVKINFPNPIHIHPVDGFINRSCFCTLIAGNKALSVSDERNLYPERVKAIRWFENNAAQDFDLYGVGWDKPEVQGGIVGKLQSRFWNVAGRIVKLRPFPSYRGKVLNKSDVLTRARFAICYENVRDLPGYITEKIFDCFFSGCIPVYWGASNVTDHIPADCFIDRRKFSDTAAVYAFLKTISEKEFRSYQQRIAAFLQSDAAYPFSSEYFAETIVRTIVKDLGN